jgi:hypothetical protein
MYHGKIDWKSTHRGVAATKGRRFFLLKGFHLRSRRLSSN